MHRFKYRLPYTDWNNLNLEGAKVLLKADWPNLRDVWMSSEFYIQDTIKPMTKQDIECMFVKSSSASRIF